MTTYLVVGDLFSEFASDSRVLNSSEFLRRLEVNDLPAQDSFVIGQGVSAKLLSRIRPALDASDAANRVAVPAEPAPTGLTHKRETGNVLITAPRLVAPQCYQFTLTSGEQLDRLSDHVTGLHIGGMVLLEAARQCVVAVLELEYMRKSPRKWGFLWNTLHTEFKNFATPVPTVIDVRVSNLSGSLSESQIVTKLSIKMSQHDVLVCEVDMGVTLCEASLLRKLEARRAKQSIEAVLKEPSTAPV